MELYALNTKLRAMRGQLLKKQDYENLCRSVNLSQVVDRLREKSGYRSLFVQSEGNEWRRGDLEDRIVSAIYADFFRLRLHVFDKSVYDYLNALFLQTLINLMKKLLCMVFDERDTSHAFNEMDIDFAAEYRVDLPRLASSKTVREFIDSLKHTQFYLPLVNAYGNNATLFSLEQELDLHYFMHLWDEQKKLDGKNREIMRRVKGTEMDLRNIMWVYRLKKHYKVTRGLILASLVPEGYKLSLESLTRMVDAEDADGVLAEAASGHYKEVFESFKSPEKDFVKAMRRAYAKEIRLHPFSLAAAAGYLFEKTEEINNITTALEGVRYNLTAAEIMEYLTV